MTLSLEDILERTQLERVQLVAWIEEGWIAPVKENDRFLFDDIDAARVNFICELMRDMSIGEEAVPVVLSLVDQLNALRGALKQVLLAAEELPDPARARIVAILREIDS